MEEISDLEDLLDLQEVDTTIDRLLERRGSLPELEEYRAAHHKVEGLDLQMGEADSRLRELDLASDKASGEIEIDEEKLEVEERRLYAGGLSARDAEHLRNEVEMLRKRVSEREDEVLGLMEEREQLQARRDGLATEREGATAHMAATEAAIKKEWAAIDTQVATLEEKRSGMASSLEPDLLALYEEIREQKEGVAAVPFVDRICGGCHLTHSAGEEVQVLKKTPPRCIHCRRILVPR